MDSEREQNPDVRPRVDIDARNLRGIAHPVRLRMLGLLRVEGPATATTLARRLGLNTGATSYHLRQLATYGFVAEETGRGTARERWWRAAHQVTHWDSRDLREDDSGFGSTFLRSLAQVYADSIAQAIDELPTLPVAWRNTGTFSDYLLQLTPDQLRALVEELFEVVGRYRKADPAVPAPEGTATVKLQLQAFPYPGILDPDPDPDS